jgi:hypothetical protein
MGLASHFNAKLTILHVVERPDVRASRSGGYRSHWKGLLPDS